MKQLKSLIAVAAIAAVANMAFAQDMADHHGTFSNKVSSDIVNLDVNAGTATFAGISDQASIEVLSGSVDAGITATFSLQMVDFVNADSSTVPYLNLGNGTVDGFTLDDWYLEFRPVQKLTVGIHDAITATGASLPVAGGIGAGNIGSEFVFVIRPIGGLRIAAGFDFDSPFWINSDEATDQLPLLNLGVDWVAGKYAVGAAIRNPLNYENLSAGVYGAYMGVANLTVKGGYTFGYAGDFAGVAGDHIVMVGASYKAGIVNLALDFAGAFVPNAQFYVGTNVNANITDAFNAGITVKANLYPATDSDPFLYGITINPSVSYSLKKHSFGAGVNVVINDAGCTMGFPVYWKYSI